MIEFRQGDILAADAEALVNTVNCVGIMGRGIALQFRNTFPDNFRAYQVACKQGEVQPGRMFLFDTKQLTNPRYIINFPTKRHWRGKSRLADIKARLPALVAEIKRLRIRSIAIPPLASGLGGLDWNDIRPLIVQALAGVQNLKAIVFEPLGAPNPKEMTRSTEVPRMTPGRAALVGLLHRYLRGLMDPYASLLELHKLMYFMQEAVEPLKLVYVKAIYGPYSENLRQVLTRIEGHLIAGYGAGGDAPDKHIELVPGAVEDAEQLLVSHRLTRNRFDRVMDLVQGFETPFGLELLATVHWVATREGAATISDVVDKTYAWGERKRRFSREQIELAWNVLRAKGWMNAHSAAS
ncbi:MAG: Appr-1-p processing protein [Dehalococcoidia bacterium]|nr:Appr-1-p processing protein [Dehalococcoidia bacterium]